MNPNLIIYRDELLLPSETFVLTQGESLQSFRPIYVGRRRTGSAALPNDRVILLCAHPLVEALQRRLFAGLQAGRRSAEKLSRLRPVLIHAHFGPDGAHILPVAEALATPLIVTFHGYDALTTDDALMAKSAALRHYVRRKQKLVRKAALFLAVSDFVRQKLLARGFPTEKTRVHYIGVDTEFFQADPAISRRKLVLFVGRLVENKGCEFLLRAMGAVQVSHPDAELVIIGDGPLRTALENQAAELHLRNYRFLGIQPQAVVRDWMNRARVFCVPSVEIASGASEGFGLVFAEAQSMGVPVVSFKTGGIPEAVADGRTGLLAPPRDWQLLAKYIDILLTAPGVWDGFSAAGRDRVTQLFNLKDQSAALEDIYRQTIRTQQSQAPACLEYAGA